MHWMLKIRWRKTKLFGVVTVETIADVGEIITHGTGRHSNWIGLNNFRRGKNPKEVPPRSVRMFALNAIQRDIGLGYVGPCTSLYLLQRVCQGKREGSKPRGTLWGYNAPRWFRLREWFRRGCPCWNLKCLLCDSWISYDYVKNKYYLFEIFRINVVCMVCYV